MQSIGFQRGFQPQRVLSPSPPWTHSRMQKLQVQFYEFCWECDRLFSNSVTGQSCSGQDDNIVDVVFGVDSAQVIYTHDKPADLTDHSWAFFRLDTHNLNHLILISNLGTFI